MVEATVDELAVTAAVVVTAVVVAPETGGAGLTAALCPAPWLVEEAEEAELALQGVWDEEHEVAVAAAPPAWGAAVVVVTLVVCVVAA
jgi:hypothetical protein